MRSTKSAGRFWRVLARREPRTSMCSSTTDIRRPDSGTRERAARGSDRDRHAWRRRLRASGPRIGHRKGAPESDVPGADVPPHARTTSKLPFKRILCPVDFSDSSLAALEFATSLAQEGDAELTILHVFEWLAADEPMLTTRPITAPESLQELERHVTGKLHALVPDAIGNWRRSTTRVLFTGRPIRRSSAMPPKTTATLSSWVCTAATRWI